MKCLQKKCGVMLKVIYLSKINTVHIVNVSEVYYGWGVDKKSKYPVNTSAVFPNEKVCVWNVSLEGANKQVISSQADSLIKISRIWADFFPANTSNQPI